ncbi:hypothetical protein I302_100476 [Kwoniella bestiolae CBS 10118]|uniref:Uncharacterized protein n=1 Tax=Kwoniella bestiolae CBS 10118 TaxID=1296100 RepID=A0A1B9G587_9TREE|nr:hypothetical protein I302_03849 [Kwoniella bestiolae CBS 10118]OCF26171.1 hypothetical protein I302_03849 [Kwoniella bestiolae CBS 10118]
MSSSSLCIPRPFEYYNSRLNRDIVGTVYTDQSNSTATVKIPNCTICLTREGEDGRPSGKVTQNPLTNTIFNDMNLSSRGDSLTFIPSGNVSERCIPAMYLDPQGSGLAICNTVQIDGLGEEGMKGLYDEWQKGEYPTSKNVAVAYTFELPDYEGVSIVEASPLLGTTPWNEYGTIPSRNDIRRKAARNCTLSSFALFQQVKDGWEAITTGRTAASCEWPGGQVNSS